MSISALEAQGMDIQLSDDASPEVYTSIGQINSITGPDGSAAEIDVTDLSSSAKEFKMGLADEGSVTLEGFYIPTDTQHAALRTKKNSRVTGNFKIVFTDSPQTTWSFAAYVTGLSLTAGVDAALTGSITLRITGSITET